MEEGRGARLVGADLSLVNGHESICELGPLDKVDEASLNVVGATLLCRDKVCEMSGEEWNNGLVGVKTLGNGPPVLAKVALDFVQLKIFLYYNVVFIFFGRKRVTWMYSSKFSRTDL